MTFLSYPNLRSLSNSNPPKLHFIDLVVLASYYLFFLLLSLGLTGFFKKEFIILGLAMGVLFFWVFFRKRIEFSQLRVFILILVLFSFVFTGILLLKGHFAGMATEYYLPWAREITLQERMPDDILFVGRFPLMPLFYAGVFSFFGSTDGVLVLLSFFFAAAAAFLMYLWLSDKGVARNYIIFGVMLLFTSPLFLDVGMHPLQEPFILFFAASFFYYLEKFQKTNQSLYFLLLFLSAVLAAGSKETGLVLLLPLGWLFIKNGLYKKRLYWRLLLLFFPLFLWLLRNYLIFDNPVFPLLNGIFRGRYYDLISVANQIAGPIYSLLAQQPLFSVWGNNILTRIVEVPASFMLMFFPLITLSFYGFWKKRKILYILLLIIVPSFFIFVESEMGNTFIRYSMLLLPLSIVYAIVGLEEVKSRIFLSAVFFFNLWGLFFTNLSSSKSQFFSPVERILSNFREAAQFIYDYKLILALALSIFFFFLLSRNRAAKYLILLAAFMYFVKTDVFHIGSWLNVWLPILALILIILIWRQLAKLKEITLNKLIVCWVAILLLLNGWGLASAYFLTHDGFAFPNFTEAYGDWPKIAADIEKLEGENKDFYILTSVHAGYFVWYHNFKIVKHTYQNFHLITNLEYKGDLSPEEIYGLLKRSKIKYGIYKEGAWPTLEPFYGKIKSRPDLFEPIFQKEKITLWRVK